MKDEKINSKAVLTAYVASHTGRVRGNNEDNFTLNCISKKIEFQNVRFRQELSQPVVAAVFDGMGGEANGEYASQIAAVAAKELYKKVCGYSDCKVDALANNFVTDANNKIRDFMEERHCNSGGSTVAAVVVKGGEAYPFSVGDSRIYLLRNGALHQISHDHTLAQRKVEAQIYTPEEAMLSTDSHKLTLFLGVDRYKEGLDAENYEPVTMRSGDSLLLCSDGLYDELTKTEMERVFSEQPGDPAYALVKAAINNGGGDNVTCVVLNKN